MSSVLRQCSIYGNAAFEHLGLPSWQFPFAPTVNKPAAVFDFSKKTVGDRFGHPRAKLWTETGEWDAVLGRGLRLPSPPARRSGGALQPPHWCLERSPRRLDLLDILLLMKHL